MLKLYIIKGFFKRKFFILYIRNISEYMKIILLYCNVDWMSWRDTK